MLMVLIKGCSAYVCLEEDRVEVLPGAYHPLSPSSCADLLYCSVLA